MLVLSRKPGERLVIGDDIVLVINRIAGNRVTIAIEAPRDVRVVRGELAPLPNPKQQSDTSRLSKPTRSTGEPAPLSRTPVALAERQAS